MVEIVLSEIVPQFITSPRKQIFHKKIEILTWFYILVTRTWIKQEHRPHICVNIDYSLILISPPERLIFISFNLPNSSVDLSSHIKKGQKNDKKL